MSKDIKFRCVYKSESNPEVKFVFATLDEIADADMKFGPFSVFSEWVNEGYLWVDTDRFTGVKDKYKVEIYERDISKQTYHTEARDEQGEWYSLDGHHTGEVFITARGVCIKNPIHYSMETDEINHLKMYKQIAGYRSEVIGNKWENPELLGSS